ncbi:MAG: RHS repeat-associated core domain-containing protein, partial [Deltaproteobacteria bacterium]|nr:RHS repeat-associated core domain-containing protein [Deltaproteobacteria bacterium]
DGATGGNAVAEKRVDFGYSDDGTRATISRFADLAGTKTVAETEKVFDELGRVTDIVHERAATDFADYDLTWDAASRITDFDFDSLVGNDGDAAYFYDDTNQLTGSDYATDWQTDESYTYDDNGNRTNTGYTTGDHNRLNSDGIYNYTHDNEGNVLTKTNISDSTSVEYTWDHRNRLTKVTFKNSGGTATEIVEYAYDHGQHWVRKTLDTNADGTVEQSQVFVHDNGQIVLDFQKTGTAVATNADLANRYLWGTNVDELLTDELVDDGSEDDNRWALADHLNSVRDLVVYNPVTGTVSVVKHVAYDAFGNVTSDSATAVKSLFLYTARPFDADTDLQNNLNRWYDLSTGRWMSVDPIGFEAGDVNLYRYVKNVPSVLVDPFGLKDLTVVTRPMVPIEPDVPGQQPAPEPIPTPAPIPPKWSPREYPEEQHSAVDKKVSVRNWTDPLGNTWWKDVKLQIRYSWATIYDNSWPCNSPVDMSLETVFGQTVSTGFSLKLGQAPLQAEYRRNVNANTTTTFKNSTKAAATPCSQTRIQVFQEIAEVWVTTTSNIWIPRVNGGGDLLVGAVQAREIILTDTDYYYIPTVRTITVSRSRPCPCTD